MMRTRFSFFPLWILTIVLAMLAGAARPDLPSTSRGLVEMLSIASDLRSSPAPKGRHVKSERPAALPNASESKNLSPLHRSLPVMFIENVGQWDSGARFLVHGASGSDLWLADNAMWLTTFEPTSHESDSGRTIGFRGKDPAPQRRSGFNLKLAFDGASSHSQIVPFDPLGVAVNYYLSDDPSRWREQVPVWGGVRYKNLYPGVDLVLISERDQWIWRFEFDTTGSDLTAVRLIVEGAESIDALDGQLLMTTSVGQVSLLLPLVDASLPDEEPTAERIATATFMVSEPFSSSRIADQLAVPNDDPADLLYSTFMGGSSGDFAWAVVVDDSGNAVMSGDTESSDFPTVPGAFDAGYNGNRDVFVLKLSADGESLLYSTFLGGDSFDYGRALTLDEAGGALVTGQTYSADFPTTPSAYDTSYNGGVYDAYVLKLSADGGALIYSTFVGGGKFESGFAIASDNTGNAVVSGETESSDFPTTSGAYDTSYSGTRDIFMLKLSADGASLLFSTFVGGSDFDFVGFTNALALDSDGTMHMTGSTQSTDFPTTPDAYNTGYNGGLYDAYVLQMEADGETLSYSTFLGGSGSDYGSGLAPNDVDSTIVVVGDTGSSDFPVTPDAYDTGYDGGTDIFLLRLSADGGSLLASTYVGGSGFDWFPALALDGAGYAVVSGQTSSSDFPTTCDAYDSDQNGSGDFFVMKLSDDGQILRYSSFVGGSGADNHGALFLDNAGNAIVVGDTESSDFPTTPGAYDTSHNGGADTVAFKLAMPSGPSPCRFVYLPIILRQSQ